MPLRKLFKRGKHDGKRARDGDPPTSSFGAPSTSLAGSTQLVIRPDACQLLPQRRITPNGASINRELCEECRNLNIWVLTLHIATFLQSARAQCPTCRLIVAAVVTYVPNLDPKSEITIFKGSFMIEIMAPAGAPDACRIAVYGRQTDASFFDPLGLGSIRAISGDTASVEAHQKVRAWLSVCDTKHNACPRMGNRRLPTRILDVRTMNESPDIRLYETRGHEEATYLTLSHCWGTGQVICLQRRNIAMFRQRIPWTVLPLTFQDAVKFTRRLGYRFLWIDSLCIIQDSEDDWRAEASNMASVYSNSSLTIAAAKGSGPHAGLFVNTGEQYNVTDLAELYPAVQDGFGSVYSRRKIPHLDPNQGCPLLSRAWVLQERMLSPRVLYFGAQELVYECLEMRQCECAFVNNGVLSEHEPYRKPEFAELVKLYSKNAPPKQKIAFWEKVVTEYTQLHLTREIDIFAALAGIAKVAEQVTNAPYLVGNWLDESIADQLLWRPKKKFGVWVGRADPLPLQARPQPRRAPSWSWASVLAHVVFPDYYYLHPSLSCFGCADSLRGDFLAPFDVGNPESSRLFGNFPMSSLTLRSLNTSKEGPDKFWEIEIHFNDERLKFMRAYLDYDLWNDDGPADGSEIYCAEIGMSWTERDMMRDNSSPDNDTPLEDRALKHFLLLRWARFFNGYYGVDGCYERFGVAEAACARPKEQPELYEQFVRSFSKRSISII